MLEDVAIIVPGNIQRGITAERIQHHNFLRPFNAFQARSKRALVVVGGNKNRNLFQGKYASRAADFIGGESQASVIMCRVRRQGWTVATHDYDKTEYMNERPIAILLSHREMYQDEGAGAVTSCVRDMAVCGRYRERIVVLGDPVPAPFTETKFLPVAKASWFYGRRTVRYAQGAANAIRNLNPALVEVHNRPSYIERLKKAVPHTPLLLYLHNDPQTMRGFKTPAERMRVLQQVAAVVCVSDYIRGQLLDGLAVQGSDLELASKVHVVLNGVDTAAIIPRSDHLRRKEILFLGRLIPEKGSLLFAQAAVLARAQLPDWRFIIIGARCFTNDLSLKNYEKRVVAEMQKLGDQGEMTGYLPRQEALGRLAEAGMSVVSSLWEEPCSLAAIEAMASGCAVIATRRGGLPEVVGDAGLLIDQDDPAQFAERMVRLALNAPVLEHWQQRARARAVQCLDIHNASAALDAVRDRYIGQKIGG